MLTVVAPVTFQLSVEDEPDVMLAGLAVQEVTTGKPGVVVGVVVGVAAETITCVVAVALPASLVAVRV